MTSKNRLFDVRRLIISIFVCSQIPMGIHRLTTNRRRACQTATSVHLATPSSIKATTQMTITMTYHYHRPHRVLRSIWLCRAQAPGSPTMVSRRHKSQISLSTISTNRYQLQVPRTVRFNRPTPMTTQHRVIVRQSHSAHRYAPSD